MGLDEQQIVDVGESVLDVGGKIADPILGNSALLGIILILLIVAVGGFIISRAITRFMEGQRV